MSRALRGYGWGPVQIAFVEDYWLWSWVAKAIVHERMERGEAAASTDVLAALQAQHPSKTLARAEDDWTALHGEVKLPAKPTAASDSEAPIPLPRRPEQRR